ncbi:MAG: exosortase/archaeosortase family protein [Myxococcota bacterium]|nr:exosortase/archaeosortase family protein [Myxococcota bacterium]
MMAAADRDESHPSQRVHWVWLLPLCLAFGPTVVWLVERWTQSVWNLGPGLIPLIVIYLVRESLKEDPPREPQASARGFLFVVPALLLLIADTAIETRLISVVALILMLPGLSLLLFGTGYTRKLLFPLVLSWLAVPIPAGFATPLYGLLRSLSSVGAEALVRLTDLPVLRDGTAFYVPAGALVVSDACSGFSALFGIVTVALILCHREPSVARRVALLVLAPIVSVASNTLRVAALILLAEWSDMRILSTPVHEVSGLLSFALAFAVMAAVAWFPPRSGRTA